MLSPRRLVRLGLTFLNDTDIEAVHLCLGLYLEANPFLRDLSVEFKKEERTLPRMALRSLSDWPSARDVSDRFTAAVEASTSTLGIVMIHGMPPHFTAPIYPQIIHANMSCWSQLRILFVSIDLSGSPYAEGAISLATTSFPGLAFLAIEIWMHCPELEHLGLHLNKTLVLEENLTDPLRDCATILKCGGYPAGHHRLRGLNIDAGTTADALKLLDLPVSRKIKIATFLDGLFPQLESVEGSAMEVWCEIGELIQAFRKQREDFVRQVDDMLAGR